MAGKVNWSLLQNSLLSQKTHYVELYVVTDSREVGGGHRGEWARRAKPGVLGTSLRVLHPQLQYLGSREAVRRRVLEVVNHVDKVGGLHSPRGVSSRAARVFPVVVSKAPQQQGSIWRQVILWLPRHVGTWERGMVL